MNDRRPRTWLILFALWLMMFSSSSQVLIIAPILPRISEVLGIPSSLQGTLVSAYAICLSLSALLTGPVSDRFGRRKVLLVGTVCMSVSLMLHGLADSFTSLLAVRALAGAAGGMLSGGAVSYVGDYFPYERRGWANGWVMSGIAAGQIIGIPIGTLLSDWFGFRWPFLMFGISMGAAALLIWRILPQPLLHRKPERLSVRSVLRGYAGLITSGPVAAASATYFLMFFSVGIYIIFLPTWLTDTLLLDGSRIASLFFAGGIVNIITGPLAGRASDVVGRKPLIFASCTGLAIVMLATTFLVHSLLTAYLVFSAAMMMVSMRLSPMQSLMTALVSSERRGMLMSLAVAVGQVGIGIGGAVAGLAYTRYGYISNTFIGAASLFLMAALVLKAIPEPR